jgi:potassium-dependent mechanosensitive channel
LRLRIDPLAAAARAAVDELTPRADAIRLRLGELGPKPDDTAPPESADVGKERDDRERALGEIDDTVRIARALLVQASQIEISIADKRRAIFADRLFARTYSLLSPALWLAVAESLPNDIKALGITAGDAGSRIMAKAKDGGWPLLAGAAVLAALLALPLGRALLGFAKRDRHIEKPTPLRKTLFAWAVLAAGIAVPWLSALLLYQLAATFELLSPRLITVLRDVLLAVSFVVFVRALLDALLSPGRPVWRVVATSDTQVALLMQAGSLVATFAATGAVLDSVNQAIAAGLALSVATQGVFAVAVALTVAIKLRASKIDPQDEEVYGQYIPEGGDWSGFGRLLFWLLVSVCLGAALAGYIALSGFAADQIVWIGVLAATLILVLELIEHGSRYLFSHESGLYRFMQGTIGLSRQSMEQIGLLVAGVGRLMILGLGLMLALAPWGIQSTDVFGSLRIAFFGLQIGDVTISISSILLGLIIFVLGGSFTRAIQGWLRKTYLPHTRLDVGLRSSITTGVGYVGAISAFFFAASYIGFSLDKLTIVVGALSVGIGLGLQSVVNNFVSGLILLAERGIKVGDWIVVGADQGHVRRINVRATEIDTFDRGTLIVPNSTLVSGTVKNWVHGDRTGRVLISLPMPREADPDIVASLMRAAAADHPEVVEDPAPRVFLKSVTESVCNFELVAFVAEIETGSRVSSDLTFTIVRALRERGLMTAAPARLAALRQDLDALGALDAGNPEPAGSER